MNRKRELRDILDLMNMHTCCLYISLILSSLEICSLYFLTLFLSPFSDLFLAAS